MKTLKIAIQKSGRLNEKSVELLKNCGLNFDNYKSSLISGVSNFPLEILFLRDDDIPEYVQDGIAERGKEKIPDKLRRKAAAAAVAHDDGLVLRQWQRAGECERLAHGLDHILLMERNARRSGS